MFRTSGSFITRSTARAQVTTDSFAIEDKIEFLGYCLSKDLEQFTTFCLRETKKYHSVEVSKKPHNFPLSSQRGQYFTSGENFSYSEFQ